MIFRFWLLIHNFNTLIKQLKVAMVVCITIFTSIQHKETLTKMSLDLNDSTKSWLTTVKVWWMIWFDLRTWRFQSICRKPSSSFFQKCILSQNYRMLIIPRVTYINLVDCLIYLLMLSFFKPIFGLPKKLAY